MTVLTLEYGLLLKAPNIDQELTCLLDSWQDQGTQMSSQESAMQFNSMIWSGLEDEYE